MMSRFERAVLRHQGHRGGLIAPHRALRTLDISPLRILWAIVSAAVVTALWVLSINTITAFWRVLMQAALDTFEVAGAVEVVRHEIHPWYTLEVPRVALGAAEATARVWWGGAVGTMLALAASWLLPKRWLPVRYVLRLMAFVQLSAQIFFWWRPGAFPYQIADYTEVLLTAGVMVIGLVPTIYGLTFYPLDFEPGKKLLITLLAMTHLVFFVPVQFLLHAVLIHAGSTLFMPVLFWNLGLTLDVFVIITLYGWAASWEVLPYRHRHWWISLRPAMPLLFAMGVLIALVGVAKSASGQPPMWHQSVEAAVSYGRYDEDLGDLQAQRVRYARSRDFDQSWTLDVGHASRFEDDGFGLGVGYRRHLRRDTSVFGGFATGTGDVIFPRWRLDAGIEHGLFPGDPLLLSVGYTHLQSKAENESDGLTLGARWYTPSPWIFSAFARREWGQPGSTTSTAFGAGVLHHRPRRTLGAGFEYGDVAYVLVGPSDAFVDFRILSANVSGSWYVGERWGLGGRFDLADAEFYRLWSFELKAFWEW